MAADQPQSETPRRKEFQDGVRILKGITSWQLWSSVLMMALLAGAIVLLLFPLRFAPNGLFHTLDPSLPVLGLLVLVSVVSGVTLRQQRRGLKLLRAGLIEQMNSVIKQRAKAEQFYGMATQDALTGLYNRRFGETRLQEEIERAEKSREPLVLIAADFDKFKHINDTYGHAAGDLALKEFSRRLQKAVRACDVTIRVGGDEFLVIFPECPLERIPEIMSRMDALSFSFEGKKIPISFSYGAAQYEPNDTPETILQRADERLYAKKAKRKAARQEEARAIVADAGFRRSERLPFEMPVQVYISRENEQPTCEEAKTLSVNAHGALVLLSTLVEKGQTLRLVNPRTQQEMECRVCRFGERRATGTSEVGVEFATVAPTFWDVPSVPADWDAARQPVLPPTDAAPLPIAPRKDTVSHLSDDIGRALRGSGSAEWNPPWAPRPESKRPEASATAIADAAPQTLSPADASHVLWDDTQAVKDVFRIAGLDSTWVPQPERRRQAAGALQKKGEEIIEEALQALQDPSEDKTATIKPQPRGAHRWLLPALAVYSALITLWVAMPRRVPEVAASTAPKDDGHPSVAANDEARMTSQGPLQSSASGSPNTGLPTESTGFSADACTATEAAQTGSSTVMSRVMPHAPGFRLSTKEDFDPEAVSWLQSGRQEAGGGVRGNAADSGGSWAAYLWVDDHKSWQVVLVAGTQMRCDLSFQSIAIAARVSKEFINGIPWDGPAPSETSGDGLLIVRSAEDRTSGVVLFLRGTDIVRSYPADYRQVPLGERK